ncbi:MAG: 50S ribosomal protein L23 [Patescibacteria group bacterium]
MDIILRQPRVTEKSTDGVSAVPPCYTFLVAPSANKFLVRQEVAKRYKVTPTKVNMILVKGKKVFTRGRAGTRQGLKKAMVYLKPGDKIEFV